MRRREPLFFGALPILGQRQLPQPLLLKPNPSASRISIAFRAWRYSSPPASPDPSPSFGQLLFSFRSFIIANRDRACERNDVLS